MFKQLLTETLAVGFDQLDQDAVDTFAATLGLGPKYVPTETKTYECPECKKQNAYYREFHPDTCMDEVLLYCPDCRYRAEETE